MSVVGSLEPQTSKHSAVLLVNDTEVVIAPKSRPANADATSQPLFSESDTGHPGPKAIDTANDHRVILRAVPSEYFLSLSLSDVKGVVWVSKSTFSYLVGKQALSKPRAKPLVSLRLLRSPKDVPKDGVSTDVTPPAREKDDSKSRSGGHNKYSVDIFVRLEWSSHVPTGIAVVSKMSWRVKEGDIICLSPSDDNDVSASTDDDVEM